MNRLPNSALKGQPAIYIDIPADNTRVFMRRDAHGFSHPICDCSKFQRSLWCGHTGDIYLKGLTSKGSYEWFPAVNVFVHPRYLTIPCVVIPSDQMFRVDALWGNPKVQDNGAEVTSQGGECIGFIDEYEGRRSIRRLLLDWLPSLYHTQRRFDPDRPLQCQHPAHVTGGSPLDRHEGVLDILTSTSDATAEKNRRIAYCDLYSILDINRCTECDDAVCAPVF